MMRRADNKIFMLPVTVAIEFLRCWVPHASTDRGQCNLTKAIDELIGTQNGLNLDM